MCKNNGEMVDHLLLHCIVLKEFCLFALSSSVLADASDCDRSVCELEKKTHYHEPFA